MKITVMVKPNSRVESVEILSENVFCVRVRTPPIEGRANERVIELLSDHLRRPKSAFSLVRGHRGKTKIFLIS